MTNIISKIVIFITLTVMAVSVINAQEISIPVESEVVAGTSHKLGIGINTNMDSFLSEISVETLIGYYEYTHKTGLGLSVIYDSEDLLLYMKFQLTLAKFICPYVNYKVPFNGKRYTNVGFDVQLNRTFGLRVNFNFDANQFSSTNDIEINMVTLGINLNI